MRKYFVSYFLLILVACVPAEQSVTERSTPANQIENSSNRDVKNLSYNATFSKQCSNKICQSFSFFLSFPDKRLRLNEQSSYIDLSDSEIEQISNLFLDLKLTSMHSNISPGSNDCNLYTSDGDDYRLDIDKGEFQQTLTIYGGCKMIDKRYINLIHWFESRLNDR